MPEVKQQTNSPNENRTKSILAAMRDSPKTSDETAPRQKVSELVPGKAVKRLELVVLRRYPRRLINSKSYTGAIAAACGKDETGIVGIVLWADDVTKVRSGDIIRIENGWCRRKDGQLVVSTGRSGSIIILDR